MRLTIEQFAELDFDERQVAMYALLLQATASATSAGESPLAELFGKGTHVTPVEPDSVPAAYPPETVAALGAPPSDSGELVLWKKKKLAPFGGVIDITQHESYEARVEEAKLYGLGKPLAYVFNGSNRITFMNKELAGKFSMPLEYLWSIPKTVWGSAQNKLKSLGVDLSKFQQVGKSNT